MIELSIIFEKEKIVIKRAVPVIFIDDITRMAVSHFDLPSNQLMVKHEEGAAFKICPIKEEKEQV